MAMHWIVGKNTERNTFFPVFFLDTSVFLCLFLCRLEYIVDRAQVNVSVEEGRVDGVGKLVVDESPSAKPTADAPGQVNTPVGCTMSFLYGCTNAG